MAPRNRLTTTGLGVFSTAAAVCADSRSSNAVDEDAARALSDPSIYANQWYCIETQVTLNTVRDASGNIVPGGFLLDIARSPMRETSSPPIEMCFMVFSSVLRVIRDALRLLLRLKPFGDHDRTPRRR
jgi:hypothetical protein